MTREQLAEWLFNYEADYAQLRDEQRGHASSSGYARWPTDAHRQPYCRWAYDQADALLKAMGVAKDAELREIEQALRQLMAEVYGALGIARAEIVAAISETNVRCIEWRLSQAEEALASHAPSASEDSATWLKAARLAEQFGEIASDHGAVTANAIAAECKRRAKHPKASEVALLGVPGHSSFSRSDAEKSEAAAQPTRIEDLPLYKPDQPTPVHHPKGTK